jgi:hypothetical protein
MGPLGPTGPTPSEGGTPDTATVGWVTHYEETPRESCMSHKSILRAALLLIVIAAMAISVAQVSASWESGSQDAASWVSGPAPGTDTATGSGS